jgi:hypothetical protein
MMTNAKLLLVALLCSIYKCNCFTPMAAWNLASLKSQVANQRMSVVRMQRASEGVADEDDHGPKDAPGVVESAKKKSDSNVGGYDPGEALRQEEINVGNPQIRVMEKERSVTSILKELAAIQQQGPQKYCILGTRHCSYLHQQIIELL